MGCQLSGLVHSTRESLIFTKGLGFVLQLCQRLVSTRVRSIFRLLLLQNKVFDAELSMAGIFEVTSAARASVLEAAALGKLLLLPVLLTDEGGERGG